MRIIRLKMHWRISRCNVSTGHCTPVTCADGLIDMLVNGVDDTASEPPTLGHSGLRESRKSSGSHSKEENPFPVILLPDFEIVTPPSSSTPSTPKHEHSQSRHRSQQSHPPCSRSRSSPRNSNSHPPLPLPPSPGLIPRHDPSMGHYGQGPPPMPPSPELPVHGTLRCEGCEGPIAGIRYKCMERFVSLSPGTPIITPDSVTCPLYDLCEKCYAHGAHTEGHRFLKIPTLAESALVFCVSSIHPTLCVPMISNVCLQHDDMEPGNQVILGLKVYTNKTAGTKIEAQLRCVSLSTSTLT